MASEEKLTIKSFAGLHEAVICPAKLTAIIGPQASGKSIAAKLLYFFRGVWRELFYAFDDTEVSVDSRKDAVKDQFKKYFPPETWGSGVFVIQYEVNGHVVTIRRSPSRGRPSEGLVLNLPPFVKDVATSWTALAQQLVEQRDGAAFAHIGYQLWRKVEPTIAETLGDAYYSGQLFIPAGRSFFANVESNVFTFISRSEKSIDPFLADFGGYLSFVKSRGMSYGKREYSTSLADQLLGGKLVLDKDQEYVETEDGRHLPPGNLSSGQQEALPLLMILDPPEGAERYLVQDKFGSSVTYIEEPEAHLFPDFQKRITERIAEFVREKEPSRSAVITTHSPYVLATLNNLTMAGRLGASRALSKKVAEVIPARLWLRRGSIAVYAFKGGTCTSVVDAETGLIDATYIDSISAEIGESFERLVDLQGSI